MLWCKKMIMGDTFSGLGKYPKTKWNGVHLQQLGGIHGGTYKDVWCNRYCCCPAKNALNLYFSFRGSNCFSILQNKTKTVVLDTFCNVLELLLLSSLLLLLCNASCSFQACNLLIADNFTFPVEYYPNLSFFPHFCFRFWIFFIDKLSSICLGLGEQSFKTWGYLDYSKLSF